MSARLIRSALPPPVRRRSGGARFALAGLAALLVAGATPPPAAHAATLGATAPRALGPSVTFYGRGWGHGVGMAQYGALGRANAGQTTAQILGHYYLGTTLGTVDAATEVRVLALSGWTASPSFPLTILGRSGSWSIDGQAGTFPAFARLAAKPPDAGSTDWQLTVTAYGGAVLLDTTVSSAFRVRPLDPTTQLQLISKPGFFDTYRGALRVLPGATKVSVVNEVGLDSYLRGVVPSEMPAHWPPAALAAQAIAARSYAKHRLHPGSGSYDMFDDSRSQVYHGILGEKSSTDAAVASTAGVVLVSDGAPIDALYHSTDGGATEDNENAFTSSTGATGTPHSYLRGAPDVDADGNSYDGLSPYETWQTATYTPIQLSSIFAADSRTDVGALSALDFSRRGDSGRLISVVLYGSGGSKQVSGGVFRSVFNAQRPTSDPSLRSTLFDLERIDGFTVAVAPTSLTVRQGAGSSYSVAVTRKYFSAPVDLSVSGLPDGVTATLDAARATGTSATLTIGASRAAAETPVGTYLLTITGSADGLTRTASVVLIVSDGIPPMVDAPVSVLGDIAAAAADTSAAVSTTWSASDPSGVISYALERQRNGGPWSSQPLSGAMTASTTPSLLFSQTYRYRVQATDGAGNTSDWVYGPTFEPLLTPESSAVVFPAQSWKTATSRSILGGSLLYTTASGATATYRFTGSSIAWVAYRGPNRGSAEVYLDDLLMTTVSLYASSYQPKQIAYAHGWSSNGTHTIKIVNLATSGHPRIDVDGFIRLFQR